MGERDGHPRPRVQAGKPFGHFQWNYGWGVWEQVIPEAAGKPGVVTAYATPPAKLSPSVLNAERSEGSLAGDEPLLKEGE